MNSRAIFFDLWNTLLYCPTRGKVKEMLKRVSMESKMDYRSFMDRMESTLFIDAGYDMERFLRELCGGGEVSEGMISQAAMEWNSRLEDAHLFKETETVLQDLKLDFKLGLISNTDRGGAEYARKTGIRRLFDTLVFSCEVGAAKPDPRIYEIAMEELCVRPRDCWMVGDNLEADVKGALNAGMKAMLIDRAGRYDGGECVIIQDLAEIRRIVG